ncbi:MAG: dihydrofolate reductase family protein [Bacteroidetes bacterium]|jgi:dihydrofolate reductase|nr:dihydrofolate reductase family protein [Bacteroidota bacterium]
MASKNIVFIGKSLDGFIADKSGSLDWLHAIPNPNNHQMGYDKFIKNVDAIVMGRTTFETVCGFDGEWPYHVHVFVLSSTIKEIASNLKNKVTLLSGTPQSIVSNIHKQGYFRLYIDGGRTVQSFLKADLIDELIITTIPILLGGGFPLFDLLPKELSFSHNKTEVFLDQIVQSHYVRNRI